MSKDAGNEVSEITVDEMEDMGMDHAVELYDDLIDDLSDLELTGAARERIDWARGQLLSDLGFLTCSMPSRDSDHFEEWLDHAVTILSDSRYLRNCVRREVLRARGFDVPDSIKAPCHHEEDKDSAVVH